MAMRNACWGYSLAMERTLAWLRRFFMGRVGRLHFFFAIIGWSIVGAILMALLTMVLYQQRPFLTAARDAGILAWVLVMIPITRLDVRRLHDLNLSGWWVAAVEVPPWASEAISSHEPDDLVGEVVMLWMLLTTLVLVFWPGTRGPNRFGADPRAVLTQAE